MTAILVKGRHLEYLQDETVPYAQFVAAYKLRESYEEGVTDSDALDGLTRYALHRALARFITMHCHTGGALPSATATSLGRRYLNLKFRLHSQ